MVIGLGVVAFGFHRLIWWHICGLTAGTGV